MQGQGFTIVIFIIKQSNNYYCDRSSIHPHVIRQERPNRLEKTNVRSIVKSSELGEVFAPTKRLVLLRFVWPKLVIVENILFRQNKKTTFFVLFVPTRFVCFIGICVW